MPHPSDPLLVAIINDRRDMAIAREQSWYRIPVAGAQKWLKDRWPPRWLAFYQTKTFDTEKYAVRYYARVLDIRKVGRRQLFPNEPEGIKSDKLYYQLHIGPLQIRPQPITSLRWRRIVCVICVISVICGPNSSTPSKSTISTTPARSKTISGPNSNAPGSKPTASGG